MNTARATLVLTTVPSRAHAAAGIITPRLFAIRIGAANNVARTMLENGPAKEVMPIPTRGPKRR